MRGATAWQDPWGCKRCKLRQGALAVCYRGGAGVCERGAPSFVPREAPQAPRQVNRTPSLSLKCLSSQSCECAPCPRALLTARCKSNNTVFTAGKAAARRGAYNRLSSPAVNLRTCPFSDTPAGDTPARCVRCAAPQRLLKCIFATTLLCQGVVRCDDRGGVLKRSAADVPANAHAAARLSQRPLRRHPSPLTGV